MYPTADLCRTQQAFHHNLATTSLLENVRIRSTKAAIAWGVEAEAAEDRETRRERTRVIAGIIASRKQPPSADVAPCPGENPDPGIAAADQPYR
jgi:hypothetical protein